MFNETFYTIQGIESINNSHTVSILLNTEHSIYNGHFPQQPVVPGVCTLQIIKECASKLLKKKVRYQSISSCKFTSLIVPSAEVITINLVLNDLVSCVASVSVNGASVLKLKATFVEL